MRDMNILVDNNHFVQIGNYTEGQNLVCFAHNSPVCRAYPLYEQEAGLGESNGMMGLKKKRIKTHKIVLIFSEHSTIPSFHVAYQGGLGIFPACPG